MKHGRQLRWVAHVLDDKNYAEFELDSDNFTRALVINGKAKELVKRKHGMSLRPVRRPCRSPSLPSGIVQRIIDAGLVVCSRLVDGTRAS